MTNKFKINKFLIVGIFIFGLFGFAHAANAATYYVATNGSDSNSGSLSSPFKTIQKATDTVQPGDKVIVKAGIYYERVIIKTSGTDGQPITFEGERGPNNEWLSIIDGSDVTSGWAPAPEKDPNNYGVYKTTAIGYEPYSMTADGDKNIARIHNNNMLSNKWINGFGILSQSPSATYTKNFNQVFFSSANFLDGVEAYFGYVNGITYIRFKDGSNPNSHNIRISPGNCVNCWPKGAAIRIDGKSNLIIRNFLIRGARYAITVRDAGSYNNIFENNRMINGHGRIFVWNGAHDNIIRNNELELNQFGFERYKPGAHDLATGNPSDYQNPYDIAVKAHFYQIFKYYIGDSAEDNGDSGIYLRETGDNNQVYGNNIHDGAVGIVLLQANNAKIYNNTIHGMAGEGIFVRENVTNAQIYDNLLYDNSINLRVQNLEKGNRSVYIYRNKFYEPKMLGQNIFLHGFEPGAAVTGYPEVWFYHNSFSGGNIAIGGIDQPLKKFYFLNNILSSYSLYNTWASSAFLSNSQSLGAFDYNWAGGIYASGVPSWFGNHNINAQNQKFWNDTTMPDFSLPVNSSAKQAGIDLSKPFIFNGQNFSALPGMQTGYFSSLKPDLGAIQSASAPLTPTADLNSDGRVNSVDAAMLMGAWGSTFKPKADINQDGIVNSVDASLMMGQWSL